MASLLDTSDRDLYSVAVLMPHVYLDQNAVINAGLKAQSDNAFEAQLNDAVANGRFAVVLSAWHWVEASRASNPASAARLADFMDSLNPVWLRERRDLERVEVNRDFFAFCNVPYDPPQAIISRVELIAAINKVPPHPAVDRTSRQFVEAWIARPDSAGHLIQSYQRNAEALKGLRKAIAEGRMTPEIKEEAERKLIEGFLPTHTPAGVLLSGDVRRQFLDIARIQQFPSLSIEAALAEHSWATAEEPDWNSMVDKFHLISALPYVDVVVSEDEYFHAVYPVAGSTGFVRAELLRFKGFRSKLL